MENQHTQHSQPGVFRNGDLSSINFPLINLWIQTCENHHKISCGPESLSIAREKNPSEKPFKIVLIDVSQRCLVHATTEARYLALSYVWGGVAQLKLSKQNWAQLSTPGFFSQNQWSEEIPAVIRDAMRVTVRLWEQFLWVDSLCIFQDDEESKHDQISNMNRIFQEATATLLAVAGETANNSLPRVRVDQKKSRGRQSNSRNTSMNNSALTRPSVEDGAVVLKNINKSTYSSRGWIFQERLLSRRCVVFLSDQVYFQCQSEFFCEKEVPIDKQAKFTDGDFLRTLNTLNQIHNDEEEERDFTIYAQLVCEYSWKQLSHPEDAVNAFAGILSVMENNFGWKFCGGMPVEPKEALERALFWVPYHRVESKVNRKEGLSSAPFPTWSWAGSTGGVDFWPVIRPRGPWRMYETPAPELKTLVSHISDIKITPLESIGRMPIMISSVSAATDVAWKKLTRIFERTRRFRKSLQLVNKREASENEEENAMQKGKIQPSSRSISTLQFKALITQASNFEFESSHPWKAPGFLHITPDCDTIPGRDGVWIKSTGQDARDVGFLYGLSLDDLNSLDKEALFFACLSETSFGTLTGTRIPDHADRFYDWAHHEANISQQACREWRDPSECYGVPRMLFNVLLLHCVGKQTFERVAVGQIDQAMWKKVHTSRQEIRLQ